MNKEIKKEPACTLQSESDLFDECVMNQSVEPRIQWSVHRIRF